jgi:hypothetical protein
MIPQADDPTVTDRSPTIAEDGAANTTTHASSQPPSGYFLHELVHYVVATADSVTSLLPVYTREGGPPGYASHAEANRGPGSTMSM